MNDTPHDPVGSAFQPMEAIADAVLFEGYILYPYRPSAIKNRQRWNFGTLYPRAFAQAQRPPERWRFQVEIPFVAGTNASVNARVRFLQLTAPQNAQGQVAAGTGDQDGSSWEQGFARARTIANLPLSSLVAGAEYIFELAELAPQEAASAPPGFCSRPCRARVLLRAEALAGAQSSHLYRLHAEFENIGHAAHEKLSPEAGQLSRRDVQDLAFLSAHLLLTISDGEFVSLLEPKPEFEAAARACNQDGVYPVLAGPPGDATRVLCSPIILYDHPQVAPESAGNFFDGTEMDEMLALRVLTLTDEEKAEMRLSDPLARAILERTETLPEEQLARVHGAIRNLRQITESPLSAGPSQAAEASDLIEQPFDPFAEGVPVKSVRVFGIDLRVGDHVRLWPQKQADIFDMELQGKVAIIEAIEQDLEDRIQFAVVLEDDPGRDLGMLRQPGHRFFFSPDEVEPLALRIS